MSKNYTTKCGRFDVGYIATPDDMAGKLEPFSRVSTDTRGTYGCPFLCLRH